MNGDDEELPPSERARDRRRDNDAGAKARAGMRTGLAKQFKQVLDVQRRRAQEAAVRYPDEPAGGPEEARRRRVELAARDHADRSTIEDREESDGGKARPKHAR